MCSDGYKKLGEFEAIHVGTMPSSSSHHDEFVFLFLIMMSLDSMERIWFNLEVANSYLLHSISICVCVCGGSFKNGGTYIYMVHKSGRGKIAVIGKTYKYGPPILSSQRY